MIISDNSFLIETLKGLYTQLKMLKTPIVCVSGNIAYGMQYDLVYLKNMNINNPNGIFLACKLSTIDDIIKNGSQNYNDLYIPWYIYNIRLKINNANYNIQKPPITVDDNIRIDDSFINFDTYKTADGIFLYRKDGYVISLYKTLLQLNKGDTLRLSIYDNGVVDNTFLAQFTIFKGKHTAINLFLRYMKLN